MELACDVCGRTFTARKGARYCSGQCRTQAYRARKTPARGSAKARRRPLPDAYDAAVNDLWKLAGRFERLSGDDRLPRNRELLRDRWGSVMDRHIPILVAARQKLDE